MSRDEGRHAGFINDTLKDFKIGVDLGFLTKIEEVHLSSSRSSSSTRPISPRRSAMPATSPSSATSRPIRSGAFHPIFKWFEKWCNDEFRHGEAFALLMRANPELLSGAQQVLGEVLPACRLRHHVCARPSAAAFPRGPRHRSRRLRLQGLQDHLGDLAPGLSAGARHRQPGLLCRSRQAAPDQRPQRGLAAEGRTDCEAWKAPHHGRGWPLLSCGST